MANTGATNAANNGTTITVIGAGVVGVMIARTLQQDGHKVILIDKDEPGMECSFGNAGYIAVDEVLPLARPSVLLSAPKMLMDPLAPLSLNYKQLGFLAPFFAKFLWACRPSQVKTGTNALIQLMKHVTPSWERVIKTEKLEPLIKRQGMMRAYESNKTFHENEGEIRLQKEHGIRVSKLNAKETHALVPCLSDKIIRSVFYEDGMHVTNPYGIVKALFDNFIAKGGDFQKTKVEGFVLTNGKITALSTSEGTQPVCKVVIAAGAHSKNLLQPLGYSVPLVAERGYHMMKTDIDKGPKFPIAIMDRSFIITPMDTGLRMAGTVEFTHPNAEPNWERAEIFADHLDDIMPDIGGSYGEKWHGNRPTLPDYLPMIGQAPKHENVFAAFGHQHLGLTLATLTAEIISDLITGDGNKDAQGLDLTLDLAPFKLDRFL